MTQISHNNHIYLQQQYMTGEEFILIVQRLFKGGLENTRSIHKESVYNKQK